MKPSTESDNVELPNETRQHRIRSLIAFWIFGLCNNFGYVVMLTAAEDLLAIPHSENTHDRKCNDLSTGVILIADIVPCMLVKLICPFLPFYANLYVALIILSSMIGLILVAFSAHNLLMVLTGVVLISISSGLGETTFLQYSHYYAKYTISSWSSGTGGAGIFGAFSYVLLSLLGIRTALLTILVVPITIGLSFWFLLPEKLQVSKQSMPIEVMEMPENSNGKNQVKDISLPVGNQVKEDESSQLNFYQKLRLLPILIPYMIPIGLVYYFEYLINQGLFELIYFENTFLDKQSQYHWLQVLYQLGVFISRSSVNLIHIEAIWIFAVFQMLNFIIYLCEGIFYIFPTIWVVFLFTFWEGLLGGGAYVNTFYRVTTTVPTDYRQFFLGTISLADAIGISLAGFSAIPLHNAICGLPKPQRLF